MKELILNNDLIFIFDWILRMTGLLALILGILSLSISRKEYISNIMVRRFITDSDFDMFQLQGVTTYVDSEISGERTIFIPQLCTIKNVKVYSLKHESGKLKKVKCLREYKNITPSVGIIFDIYYAEGIPSRMIEWTSDYGVRGKHIFSENGFNSNVDILYYCYKYGLIANIRRKLDLR